MSETEINLNLAYLKEMSGGSLEFEKELINMLLEQIPETISRINNSYSINDLEDIRAAAHKLKSSVGIFDLNQFKEKLFVLEQQIKNNGNIDDLPSMIESINIESDKSIDILNKLLKSY